MPERPTPLGRGAPAWFRALSRFLSDAAPYGSTERRRISGGATRPRPHRVPRLWHAPDDPQCTLPSGIGPSRLSPRAGGRTGAVARLADRTGSVPQLL